MIRIADAKKQANVIVIKDADHIPAIQEFAASVARMSNGNGMKRQSNGWILIKASFAGRLQTVLKYEQLEVESTSQFIESTTKVEQAAGEQIPDGYFRAKNGELVKKAVITGRYRDHANEGPIGAGEIRTKTGELRDDAAATVGAINEKGELRNDVAHIESHAVLVKTEMNRPRPGQFLADSETITVRINDKADHEFVRNIKTDNPIIQFVIDKVAPGSRYEYRHLMHEDEFDFEIAIFND